MMDCGYFDTTRNGNHSSFLTPTVVGRQCALPCQIFAESDPPPSKNTDVNRFPLITSNSEPDSNLVNVLSLVAAPCIWNRLPTQLKTTTNTSVSRRNLKTFLFQSAYRTLYWAAGLSQAATQTLYYCIV